MSSEPRRSEILRGTLDLMVLKTLDTMGPLHGYGIARRIEQISEDALQINQGTIYAVTRPPGAEAVDLRRVGHLRQQPAGEVLLDHQSGA